MMSPGKSKTLIMDNNNIKSGIIFSTDKVSDKVSYDITL